MASHVRFDPCAAVSFSYEELYSEYVSARTICRSVVEAVSGNDVDKVYTGIVADIAKLARTLAKTEIYGSANGPDALLAFAEHLEGIVSAVGANPFEAIRDSVRNKQAG